MLKRMWINQPSIFQPLHKYHGLNVIADIKNSIIYLVSGNIISMETPKYVLSEGWIKKQ